jgi:diaminohydroxyphosphoribosylaminopyrimidine deaminase/5-amino-6-(5-phosphoribosylamino)uracil reductase
MKNIKDDKFFMNLALSLAKRNIGKTGSNPSVGCVIVSNNNEILSTGVTGIGGSPHAEYNALKKIKKGNRKLILYTTLEPCSHIGKNPSCVKGIVDARVSKVIIALKDKNPLVNGKGIKALKKHKIDVVLGVLEKEALPIYSSFFYHMKTGKPNINLKIASSADGKTALKNGKSKWITNQLSRNYGHRLRSLHDGIMVGINTVLIDNPSLDCRLPGLEVFSPTRIILDSRLRIPLNSKIVKTGNNINTFIFTAKNPPQKKMEILESNGIKVIEASKSKNGLSFERVLTKLGKLNLQNILIEGGHKLIATAFASKHLKDVYWFSSEKIIGEEGLSSVGKLNISNLDNSPNLRFNSMINLNNNYLKIFERKI